MDGLWAKTLSSMVPTVRLHNLPRATVQFLGTIMRDSFLVKSEEHSLDRLQACILHYLSKLERTLEEEPIIVAPNFPKRPAIDAPLSAPRMKQRTR